MCGIVGAVGIDDVKEYLLHSLKRLEYRGYDSAGIATINGARIELHRSVGMISRLEERVAEVRNNGRIGIAHTRWATHGAPTERNAHPHVSADGQVAIVHNGIVENHSKLRKKLEKLGVAFASETDSEVIAQLIAHYHANATPIEEATRRALNDIRGTYGILVLSLREPDALVAARMGSPMILGVGNGCNVVASDVAAILSRTRQVIYLEDGEIVRFDDHSYVITDLELKDRQRAAEQVDIDVDAIELAGFPHYMLKEIYEQPATIENTCRGRVARGAGDVRLGGLRSLENELLEAERIIISACGTSWHAGLIGEYYFEKLADMPTEVDYASELRYRNPVIRPKKDVAIFITQSGETADTLAALREIKLKGARALGVCNVVGSTIARETDAGVFTHAGIEIGVASTKAFCGQLTALLMMALFLGRRRRLSGHDVDYFVEHLLALPEAVHRTLNLNQQIQEIAGIVARHNNMLYLGRGCNFPVALEGALKMKEISYIHAEGYPAAEMKHGPIALIDENMPTVVIANRDRVYEKVLANIEEVRARKGYVIAIATEGDTHIKELANRVIYVPEVIELLQPLVNVIPLQLLAYHTALLRDCNVDKPRNLAKSVTVE